MKIAVTGAFSYTGKYVTQRLLERGVVGTPFGRYGNDNNTEGLVVLPAHHEGQRRVVLQDVFGDFSEQHSDLLFDKLHRITRSARIR